MSKLLSYMNRNKFDLSGDRVNKGVVLEQWKGRENVGDFISSVVFNWMLSRRHLVAADGRNAHLFAVGSILGSSRADGVVWGSGIIGAEAIRNVVKRNSIIKYDIRALRGPITRDICLAAGYNCKNSVLGDPGVLLPLIYSPTNNVKKYKYCIINHYINESLNNSCSDDIITISAGTNDYERIVKCICESEIVVSSSLHGIILAEAYHVPAIWLMENMKSRTLKYYDYYYSTERFNIPVATSFEEALKICPIHLPNNIVELQNNLIDSFPYDLWIK